MQQPLTPFFREAGTGEAVVCLHANASSSTQWRALIERLSPTHHVLAADLCGAGKSPPWPTGRPVGLRDEVALLAPVLARCREPFTLVGHSHGAAVALIVAVMQPARVKALALYEPTLFSLVDAASPPPNDADGIRAAVAASAEALDAGDPAGAARCFIDYWMGVGAYDAMPPARQGPIAAAVVNVRGWAHALMREPTPLQAFAGLTMPVLYMTGRDSPAASLAVARQLAPVLPNVERVEFEGLGHMGPVTHPDTVNDAIVRFLGRV